MAQEGVEQVLGKIDAKLSALLALLLDQHLRRQEDARVRPKERSIDRLLRDSGISAADIARLLGKTERAVNLQLKPRLRKGR